MEHLSQSDPSNRITDFMPFEKIDIDSIDEERRKSIAKSIRPVSVEELKKLGNEIFHDLDDPWRETFFRFIEEHSHATIHHATSSDGVHFIYCRDEDRGIWFLPGSGKGALSVKGRQMIRAAIEGKS
jgi:hypothetical protein